MKKLLLGSVAMVAAIAAGPAFAADMPVKAPIIAPVVAYSWSGCYVGVHAGYGWGRNKNDFGRAVASGGTENLEAFPPEFGPFDHRTSGGVAGGQLGCNYQAANNFVVGIEGEVWWSGIKGGFTAPEDGADPGTFSRFESRNLWDADLALRFGYAWNRSLLYGKVGVAFGRFQYTETHDDFPTVHSCPGGAPVCSVNFNNTQAGLLLGVGWEYAFANNWSAKVEYDYINYGSHTIPYPNASATIQNFSVSDTKQIVKVGLNYKFDWAPGPVVSKY